MTLFKSLLLGSAVGIVAVAGAQAADLPSKKAAPATYVKICDAYGAGFFFIPGTDTCVKLGGRVRYDIGYAPKGDYITKDGAKDLTIQDTWGQHVRARVDVESRTATGYGVVRTVAQLRLAQTTGVLNSNQSPTAAPAAADLSAYDKAGPTLERGYIQFMGFTAGRANSIFANGPSLAFGANSHFPSFANGSPQLAYTAVLGGGFSATIGIEDHQEHKQQNLTSSAPFHTPYDKMPVVIGNVGYDQAWGRIQVSGAIASNRTANDTATSVAVFDKTKQGYAYAGFLTYNADMVGKGDKFYLLSGYSSGITSLGYKDASNASSSNARDITGVTQSYKNFTCTNTTAAECQNTNTTWVSTAFVHNWTAQVRSNVMAGMAWVDPGSLARGTTGSQGSLSTQKATFSSIGTNLIWSPTKDFDIGVEVLYNRQNLSGVAPSMLKGCLVAGATPSCSANGSNVFTRIRLERTF